MTVENYYRLSLAFPLLVPLTVWGVRTAAEPMGMGQGTAFEAVLILSLIFGGVPYLLTAGCLLWRMRGMNGDQMARLSWLAPLYMVLVGVVVWALWAAVLGSANWGFPLLLALFALALGYGYVAIVNGGLVLLRIFGRLRDGGSKV